ncbi:MAG TPA: Ku protein [Sphingomonadaceae bacterium]|nr:Ku protein [Sphingomonadaceae bacterium]
MAARAYWQGQIRLALVSIPVEIYSATKSGASVSFRQIHEPTGKPIKYEKSVQGVGPVDPDEIVKGYEYEKGSYVLVDESELDAVKLESKKTLELTQFVDLHEIDQVYYEKPYYVVPADDLAEEAFVVLREALKKTKKVGLGQLALRGREYVVSLKACGRGMVLETLRYADEVNKAQGFFREIADAAPDPDLLDLATTLIEKKAAPFDAANYHDRYIDAVKALIDEKLKNKGKKVTPEADDAPRGGSNVIDLMAALKQSLEKGADPAAKPAAKPASGSVAPKAKAPPKPRAPAAKTAARAASTRKRA